MSNEHILETENEKKRRIKKKGKITLGVLGGIFIALSIFYFAWARPLLKKPISEPLALPTPLQVAVSASEDEQDASQSAAQAPSNLSETPIFIRPTPLPGVNPVCGKDPEWIVLMVGIDYRGDDYLYGLADVIRVIRIDFVNMTVNMVALPRDLLVEAPEGRFTVPDPYKINQAYLFGTPGMGHYLGSGLGAGALAEVIQYNFGVPIDHYGVINFETFVGFINAINGIEVDLPGPVTGSEFSFPAGPQTLNGEQALDLARTRKGYGDAFRVSNQTIIIRAVLNKLVKPAYWAQIPGLLEAFEGAFLTDLSIEQLTSLGVCFLRNFNSKNLETFEAPADLLRGGSAFIPTLNNTVFVYNWDQALIEWMHTSLLAP